MTRRYDTPALRRALKFLRSLAVGSLASVADFVTLGLLVELCGLSAASANVPSLLAGVTVQFVGNRYFTFGAGGGDLTRQATRFAAAEAVTLCANALVFHLLTRAGISWPVARLLGSFVVFATVSYPLWQRVFRAKEPLSRP